MDNVETGRARNEGPGAPTTHTAILIMHGVGEQNPYEPALVQAGAVWS